MRLAVDGRWLNHRLHGISRYCHEMLRALPLQREDQVLILYNRSEWSPFQRPGLLWIDVNCPLFHPQEALKISRVLRQLKPDLIWIPAYWRPYICPAPWLITLHDLIHLRPPVAPKYQLYYALLKRLLPNAAAVLTVSQASASRLRAWQPRASVRAIPLAPQDIFFSPPSRAQPPELAPIGTSSDSGPESYLLFVGNHRAHKNAALALWLSRELDYPLICVGLQAIDFTQNVKVQLSASQIYLALAPGDSALSQLYARARCLIFPSLEEGFGLPALEALASGCPVLSSDLAVTREVSGEQARFLPPVALSFSECTRPLSSPAWTAQKKQALSAWKDAVRAQWQSSDTEEMRQQRRRWAARWNWEKTALELRKQLDQTQMEQQQ